MSDTPRLASYLINLPRSVERRAQMEARLAALGLEYRVFPGVDGRADWARLAPTLDAEAFRRNVGRDALPGDVGCYHAHLDVWRDFLGSDADVALVMEDDVVFHPEFGAALEAALAAWDQWDLLKLNRIRAKQPIRQGRVGDWVLNAYLGPATGHRGLPHHPAIGRAAAAADAADHPARRSRTGSHPRP